MSLKLNRRVLGRAKKQEEENPLTGVKQDEAVVKSTKLKEKERKSRQPGICILFSPSTIGDLSAVADRSDAAPASGGNRTPELVGFPRPTFEGNDNTYLRKKNVINPPFMATKIRIRPYSNHQRTVCMRVEFYGCNYT
ncbi:unnamed protein product, partial [Notodromas monacha]